MSMLTCSVHSLANDIFHLHLFPRYKHEIRKEDKEALRKLIKVQYHYQVSPEITRELDASRCDPDAYYALFIEGFMHL